jgi:1,2-phenylacetyl-CoA epoxidase PaaB subunit
MVALDAGDRRMFNKLDMSRAIFFLRESPVSLFVRRKAQIELDLNEILLSSGDREDQGLRSIRQKPFLH